MDVYAAGSLVALLQILLVCAYGEECIPIQYLQIWSSGTVKCHFPESTYGVLWYNSSDVLNDPPIVVFKGSSKSGYGYASGEYDIDHNGSLLITNVDVEDETVFTVIKIPSTDATIPRVHYLIKVVATVSPAQLYPVIDECRDDGTECFVEVDESTPFNCHIRNSRPIVHIEWIERTDVGDKNITSLLAVQQHGLTSTSTVTTRYQDENSPLLSLLVCRAIDPADLLNRNESFVLVGNKDNPALDIQPTKKYFTLGARMSLDCGNASHSSLLVWKVQGASEDPQSTNDVIIHRVYNLTKHYVEDFHLSDNGTLTLDQIQINHEGVYYCISKTLEDDVVVVYEVSVFVHPVPSYPVVEGCNPSQYCILDVIAEGKLACAVYGVRPEVTLEWISSPHQVSSISFSQEQRQTVKEGELFNVFLTVKFRGPTAGRVSVECLATGQSPVLFDLSTKLDLLISDPDVMRKQYLFLGIWYSIMVLLVSTFVIALRIGCRTKRCCKYRMGPVTSRVIVAESFTPGDVEEDDAIQETILMIQETERDGIEGTDSACASSTERQEK